MNAIGRQCAYPGRTPHVPKTGCVRSRAVLVSRAGACTTVRVVGSHTGSAHTRVGKGARIAIAARTPILYRFVGTFPSRFGTAQRNHARAIFACWPFAALTSPVTIACGPKCTRVVVLARLSRGQWISYAHPLLTIHWIAPNHFASSQIKEHSDAVSIADTQWPWGNHIFHRFRINERSGVYVLGHRRRTGVLGRSTRECPHPENRETNHHPDPIVYYDHGSLSGHKPPGQQARL